MVIYSIDNGFTNFAKRHLLKALECCENLISDEDYIDSFADGGYWEDREKELEKEEKQIKKIFDNL